MEHRLNILPVLLMAMSFTACEIADIGGMLLSDQSVNQRFEQSMSWNAQNPYREIVVPSDDYVILAMSDSHVGGTDNLDHFIHSARELNASAMVMAGDLTTGHDKDYAIFQQRLPLQDSLPSFQIAGNHDLYFKGWGGFYSRFGSSTYLFTVKTPVAEDLFICLDTGGGTVGSRQLNWLKDVLENIRPDFRHCIVFTHNNFFRNRRTASTNPPVEELYVLVELFLKHQVDMVVTGHDHRQYAEVFGNTTYITMDALMDGLEHSGFFQMQFNDGIIEYTFLNIPQ